MHIVRNRSKGPIFFFLREMHREGIGDFWYGKLKACSSSISSSFQALQPYCPKIEDERLELLHTQYTNVVGCPMYAMC